MELGMRVIHVYSVKGRGPIVVVDLLPPGLRLNDILSDGRRSWILTGIESARDGGNPGLLLKEVEEGAIRTHPEEGAELTLQPTPLMKQKVGNITVEEAIEVFRRSVKERSELAGHLKKLQSAIMHLELHMGQEDRMAAFKEMHEAFNAIPPKWLHK